MMFSVRDLKRLILPLVVEQILLVTVGMADTMMVSSVGQEAISAISLVDSINLLLINVFSALGTGGAIVTAQYLGREDDENASLAAKQLIYVVGAVATVVMAVCLLGNGPILRANGLTEQELAEAYSSFYGSGGTQGENGGVSSAELLSAIKEYLPYAVRLQGMDAGSYAGTSAEERQVDSMIWTLIETYQSAGGSMADIESDENYRKLDKSRARRLSEEYSGRPQ